MTEPEQKLVYVADLRTIVDAWRAHDVAWWPQGAMQRIAVIAYPEPEWGPTDDMRAKARRVLPHHDDDAIDEKLRAFHGVGLL